MTVQVRNALSGGAVGQSVARVDLTSKLDGSAQYAGDITVPGMLAGAVLRSPHASARILSIDTSGAQAVPGVVGVLTAADLSDIDNRYGHALRDRPILAVDQVRFVGEPVVAVAAHTLAQAEEAIRRILVEYEILERAVTIEEAIRAGAHEVHTGETVPGFAHGLGVLPPRDGNICYRYDFSRGDVRAEFDSADVVVEGTYRFPAVYQYAMETHTVVAHFRGSQIEIWASCQHPFLVRTEIAQLFGMTDDQVRIHVPFLGGGFGSKSYTKMEPVTVALSRKVNRPVRIVNRVDESMVTTRRHGMVAHMRTAASANGELLAREATLWLDTGAYADNGPRVTATAGDAAPGPYRWKSVAVEANCVYTNTAPAGSYRAFGATHMQWIGESQIDEVARRVGIDPLDFRRRHLLRRGEEVRPGGKPLDADLVGDIERAATAVGWGTPLAPDTGRGLSVGLLAAGAHPVSMASVRMTVDGHVTVLVGSTEMGQGTRTVMAQIAAEVLGIDPSSVRVDGADTRFTPYDRSTGASRSTTVAGKAVQRAAQDVLDKLTETGASLFDVTPDLLRVEDGALVHDGKRIAYPDIIKARFGFSGGELQGVGEVRPEGGSGSYAEGPVFWEVCVAAAEVRVDRVTGEVEVVKTATVADVGKAINPLLVERQDEGGAMQGLGNCMFEEMLFADDGSVMNDTLLEYRVPTAVDLPSSMVTILVENEDGPGPFGAKGCGEGAVAAVPGAIVNALGSAGVPVVELPLTPERVWRRIREIEAADALVMGGGEDA